MELPGNRFSFKHRRKKSRFLRNLFLAAVLLPVVLFIFNTVKNKEYSFLFSHKPGKNEKIITLWESHQYEELIKYTGNILTLNSTDYNALVFSGFSNFYEGASHISLEERIPFIDNAVMSLRKALVFNSKNLIPQVYYVLGKAYYHKGYYYSDLAVKYLELSLDGDYAGEDTYEYLGLIYSSIGNKKESAEFFEKAVLLKPSDLLYLALAQIYLDLKEYDKSEEYLIRTINKTADSDIKEKSYFFLVQIYENRGDVIKMEDTINKILAVNSRSADAYYKLGELFENSGDKIKARSEWRKALRIDPEHYGARLKLF